MNSVIHCFHWVSLKMKLLTHAIIARNSFEVLFNKIFILPDRITFIPAIHCTPVHNTCTAIHSVDFACLNSLDCLWTAILPSIALSRIIQCYRMTWIPDKQADREELESSLASPDLSDSLMSHPVNLKRKERNFWI